MIFFSKIKNKLNFLYRRYIFKDAFLIEVDRWFKDNGDEKLRLDYPLNSEDVVFDVGGYHGDFAAEIYEKYGCKVYIFEPVPEFYSMCLNRFKGNNKIICLNYGLSSKDEFLYISLAENASSFTSPHAKGSLQKVQLRSVVKVIHELDIKQIGLMKINIEGGEFDVIPSIIESGDIDKVKHLQIQFHNFVANAEMMRDAIRSNLAITHKEIWSYEFVWESWDLKDLSVE